MLGTARRNALASSSLLLGILSTLITIIIGMSSTLGQQQSWFASFALPLFVIGGGNLFLALIAFILGSSSLFAREKARITAVLALILSLLSLCPLIFFLMTLQQAIVP